MGDALPAARLWLGQVLPRRSSTDHDTSLQTSGSYLEEQDPSLISYSRTMFFVLSVSVSHALIAEPVVQPALNGATRSRTGIIGRNRVPDNH